MGRLKSALSGLLLAFDRAACTDCARAHVRWVLVDGDEVVAHLCANCTPRPMPLPSMVIDLGRERVATTAELDQLAVRRWIAAPRPGVAASRMLRNVRIAP